MSRHDNDDAVDHASQSPNPLSLIEAISYTTVIGFIAAMAAGLFDGMVPWK